LSDKKYKGSFVVNKKDLDKQWTAGIIGPCPFWTGDEKRNVGIPGERLLWALLVAAISSARFPSPFLKSDVGANGELRCFLLNLPTPTCTDLYGRPGEGKGITGVQEHLQIQEEVNAILSEWVLRHTKEELLQLREAGVI
jgi:hypothetical protein